MSFELRSFTVGLAMTLALCLGVPQTGIGERPENAETNQPQKLNFERHIAPVLKTYCWKCHGGEKLVADLDLRSLPLIVQGGESGPAIVRGSAEDSLLFQKLSSGEMPPETEKLKLGAKYVDLIRAWLDAGAPANYEAVATSETQAPVWSEEQRSWWAFRKPVRPSLPTVQQTRRVRTPVDLFLLRRLEKHRLGFSPDADPLVLVRRIYLDLIGLPPSPEEVDAFVSDGSPAAYERLIDRLLASPRYGERWGRHWLDATGYVDAGGVDNDASIIKVVEGMWRYRDYVIQSFNDGKSYDRFLLEQLAGDELVDWRSAKRFTPGIKESLIATGFLRQAADPTDEDLLNTADIRHQVLYDTVQVVATNVLALTVHCARCHDHKFDPISQQDYFRLAAIFTPAYNIYKWTQTPQRFLADVPRRERQEIEAYNTRFDPQFEEFAKQIADLRRPSEDRLLDGKLVSLPQPIRSDLKTAIRKAADARDAVETYLVETLGPLVELTDLEIDEALDKRAREGLARVQERVSALEKQKRRYGKIQALWEQGARPPTYVYRGGDYTTPGLRVQPGVVAILDDEDAPFAIPESAKDVSTSGRRTALARWLTRADHPLTSRVIVNRVWQQFFGNGIVTSSDNFGQSGATPTHPRLLDWLSTEFVRSDWKFKRLHRTIVTSTAYRQASSRPNGSTGEGVDPSLVDEQNRWLWRMPLRRLESEIIRDRVLAVSGALDRMLGGPPLPLKVNADSSVEIDIENLPPQSTEYRRSVYVFARRNYQLSELNTFDQPIVTHNCTRRRSTAVVLQSLTMLNSKFTVGQSEKFAQRVKRTTGSDTAARIDLAFRLALSRKPSAHEFSLAEELLNEQTKQYRIQKRLDPPQAADAALKELCHMLLNSNEFLYVE